MDVTDTDTTSSVRSYVWMWRIRTPPVVWESRIIQLLFLLLILLVMPGPQGALQAGAQEGGEASAEDEVQTSARQEVPGLPHQRPPQGVQGVPQDCLHSGLLLPLQLPLVIPYSSLLLPSFTLYKNIFDYFLNLMHFLILKYQNHQIPWMKEYSEWVNNKSDVVSQSV